MSSMEWERFYIVDGEGLVSAALGQERDLTDWGCSDSLVSPKLKDASKRVNLLLEQWVAECSRVVPLSSASNVLVAFCDPKGGNWRREVFNLYELGRRRAFDAVRYPTLMRSLSGARAVSRCGLSQFDIIGLLATGNPLICEELEIPSRAAMYVIGTARELSGIPSWQFNPERPAWTVFRVTEEEANREHIYRTLVGDRRRGLAGCPGVGRAAALHLMAPTPTPSDWRIVLDAFESVGLSREHAILQARLAHILRAADYSGPGQIRLWEPAHYWEI